MSGHVDITGRWSGSYFQHGRPHPISAVFNQFDTHLQGKMTDGDTQIESSVFDAAFEAGLPPGADEQIVVRLREQYPDAPRDPILAATHLPEFSTVEGEVRGRTVRFIKRYLGGTFSGWRIGDRLIGTTVADQVIQYTGTLSDDGGTIEGRWSVDGDAKSGTPRSEGGFRLQRQED